MKKYFNKFKSYQVLILALFLIGTFFRAYMPGSYIFGFDQVQILTNAEQIAQGNLTLIGPRTGPADMFTGPLVYYIAALFTFIVGTPWAVVAMSTSIAAVTGIFLYCLSKRYLSKSSASVTLSIWAFSPFLIHFDRIAWNPDLTLLASSLVFFPLLGFVKNKKVNNLDLLFIFLGSFLGFQAHFSGLLLPVMLFATLLVFRKLSILPLLASGFGLLASIVPTLLFDARNGWLNVSGFINFISEEEAVGSTLFFDRLTHSIKVAFEILGSLIPLQLERSVSVYLGLFFFVVLLWQLIKRRVPNAKNTFISLFWIVSIIMIFSLYRSKSPEYYFFIFLPALFVLLTDLVTPLLKKIKVQKGIVVLSIMVLSLYIVSNFNDVIGRVSLNIDTQMNIATDISAKNQKTPISKIAYDIQSVDTLGMKYFVDQLLPLPKIGSTVHIARTDGFNERYDEYGLWIDPRTDKESNYLVLETKVFETANNVNLLQDKYLGDSFGPHEAFQIVKDDQLTGYKIVVVNNISNPFLNGHGTYKQLHDTAATVVTGTDWKVINFEEYIGYIKEYPEYSLVYVTKQTVEEFLIDYIEINAMSIQPGIL